MKKSFKALVVASLPFVLVGCAGKNVDTTDSEYNELPEAQAPEESGVDKEAILKQMTELVVNTRSRIEKILKEDYYPEDTETVYEIEGAGYFTTDINGDGIPELWIQTPYTGGFGYNTGVMHEIYMLQKDGTLKEMSPKDMYYENYGTLDGQVYGEMDMKGVWSYGRFEIANDKIFVTEVAQGSDFDEDQRPEISDRIQYLDWIPLQNLRPLKETFK